MESVRNYVQTLCCGGLICAVVLALGGGSGSGYAMRRMICGMFLAMLALAPLKKVDFGEMGRDLNRYSQQAQIFSREGRQQAQRALDADISARCEAYILDRAEKASIPLEEALVSVDPETHLPCSVLLKGRASAAQRQRLEAELETALGIGKGGQEWGSTE